MKPSISGSKLISSLLCLFAAFVEGYSKACTHFLVCMKLLVLSSTNLPMHVPTVIERKRQRSSTQSSEELELDQPPIAKKKLHQYFKLKMDLLARDMSDLRSKSDPSEIIRLLYRNSLSIITKLLAPHLAEVKVAADNYCQLDLHQEAVEGSVIKSAASVDSLFSQMYSAS